MKTSETGSQMTPELQSSLIDDLPSFEEYQWLATSDVIETGSIATDSSIDQGSAPDPPSYTDSVGDVASIPSNATSYCSIFRGTQNQTIAPSHFRKDGDIKITLALKTEYGGTERTEPRKRYTTGEFVFGEVTATNNSDSPVPFHSFRISLEGVSKAGSKRVKFLDIVDFRASCIKGGYIKDIYDEGTVMKDGSIYGFPENHILYPKVTYKKFFVFRFPEYLFLRSTPHSGVTSLHLIPPPSFGFPIFSKEVVVPQSEYYGRLLHPGAPFKFHDLAPAFTTNFYTINARLFGQSGSSKELYSIQEADCYLLFVPSSSKVAELQENSCQQFERLSKYIRNQISELQEKVQIWKQDGNLQRFIQDKKRKQLFHNQQTPILKYDCGSTISTVPISTKRLFRASKEPSSVLSIRSQVSLIRLRYNSRNFPIISNSTSAMYTQSIPFQMEFTTSSVLPPQIEYVSTRLLVATSETQEKAPMDFDTWFMNMSTENFTKLRSTYKDYKQDLNNILMELKDFPEDVRTELTPAKHLLSMCESFETLTLFKHYLPLYKSKNVFIKWEKQGPTYYGSCEIPALDEHINKGTPFNLMPSFQSFLLSRTYGLEVTFKMKGYKNKETLIVPLDFIN